MKSYTDIEQSKKLAKILPLESADMCYLNDGTAIKIDANPYTIRYSMWKDYVVEIIPCWSLAALLDILPKIHGLKPILDLEELSIQYSGIDLYVVASNPVDACYETIIRLNELKLL